MTFQFEIHTTNAKKKVRGIVAAVENLLGNIRNAS
jgi:hypothetical protein